MSLREKTLEENAEQCLNVSIALKAKAESISDILKEEKRVLTNYELLALYEFLYENANVIHLAAFKQDLVLKN